jgi:2-(3-amino-3-carboxypropyl)histidine synthase
MEESAPPEPRRFTGRKEATGTPPSDGACSSSALVPGGGRGGGGRGGGGVVKRHVVVRQQVPDDILHDANLNAALEVLPANYNFEVGAPRACANPAASTSERGL